MDEGLTEVRVDVVVYFLVEEEELEGFLEEVDTFVGDAEVERFVEVVEGRFVEE